MMVTVLPASAVPSVMMVLESRQCDSSATPEWRSSDISANHSRHKRHHHRRSQQQQNSYSSSSSSSSTSTSPHPFLSSHVRSQSVPEAVYVLHQQLGIPSTTTSAAAAAATTISHQPPPPPALAPNGAHLHPRSHHHHLSSASFAYRSQPAAATATATATTAMTATAASAAEERYRQHVGTDFIQRAASGGGGLRRSHTNAADFVAARRSKYHQQQPQKQNPPQLLRHHHFGGSTQVLNHYQQAPQPPAPPLHQPQNAALPPPSQAQLLHPFHAMAARSRSNIATLCPPQQPRDLFRLPPAAAYQHRSFCHLHEMLPPLNRPRSGVFLSQSCRDLSQPLHVDCSVEYDLGNQPKIPRDSAPLLIIHPAFQQQQQNRRFHPYGSSEVSSASTPPDNTSVSSPDGSISPVFSPSPSGTSTPIRPRHADHWQNLSSCRYRQLTQSAPSTKGSATRAAISRQSSFLVSGCSNNTFGQQQKHQASVTINGMSVYSEGNVGDSLYGQQQQAVTAPSLLHQQQVLHNNPTMGKTHHRSHHRAKQQQQREQQHLYLSMPNINSGAQDKAAKGSVRPRGVRRGLQFKTEAIRRLSASASASAAGEEAAAVTELGGGGGGGGGGFCDSGLGTPSSLMEDEEEGEQVEVETVATSSTSQQLSVRILSLFNVCLPMSS